MNKITGGKPGPGRPKGSPNKVTKAAKDLIAEVADRIGGADRFEAWVRENAKNEHAYWSQIYPKLLPLQVSGDPNAPLVHEIRRSFVDVPSS